MKAVVKKWRNSLGIRMPNIIVHELSLKDGSFVDMNVRGKVIIEPITPYIELNNTMTLDLYIEIRQMVRLQSAQISFRRMNASGNEFF